MTRGTHYVYAKAGEKIAVATNQKVSGTSQADLDASFKVFTPTGAQLGHDTPIQNAHGIISSRNAEIAGPKAPNGSGGTNTYTPVFYTVPSGGDGIYRVELYAKTTTGNLGPSTGSMATVNNNAATRIDAWDITVFDGDTPKSGRVYANVLNLATSALTGNGFYGIFYVQTRDGYTYKVNNNGMAGGYFSFFVNNNGFTTAPFGGGDPTYKSSMSPYVGNTAAEQAIALAASDGNNWPLNPDGTPAIPANTGTKSWFYSKDARTEDSPTGITHKMFYSMPAADLPTTANVHYSATADAPAIATSTWLKIEPLQPEVSVVEITGIEGSGSSISRKGGLINFNASEAGTVEIVIRTSDGFTGTFVERTIVAAAQQGANSIEWDGLDGNGNVLESDEYPLDVAVTLHGAEVHFPYIRY